MKIRFTDHAHAQLKERNLLEADVVETVRKPDHVIRQSSARLRAIRKIRKRNRTYLLVVIYDEKDIFKEIVTAFITSKIKKYL